MKQEKIAKQVEKLLTNVRDLSDFYEVEYLIDLADNLLNEVADFFEDRLLDLSKLSKEDLEYMTKKEVKQHKKDMVIIAKFINDVHSDKIYHTKNRKDYKRFLDNIIPEYFFSRAINEIFDRYGYIDDINDVPVIGEWIKLYLKYFKGVNNISEFFYRLVTKCDIPLDFYAYYFEKDIVKELIKTPEGKKLLDKYYPV